MIDTPHITHISAQPTAVIPLIVSWDEIRNVMGPGIREVYDAIAAQALSPTGPWCTHHRRRPTDTFDFEISVPISAPVTATGRVQPSEWPAMMVARTTYHGPYEGLADAWGELTEWLEANGHQRTEDLWESYVSGPVSDPDPASWKTELIQPLAEFA